jgi:OTU domain-containing protein 5
MEAHSIFGDNVNNMLCYLLETETNGSHDGENVSRRKGKAAE